MDQITTGNTAHTSTSTKAARAQINCGDMERLKGALVDLAKDYKRCHALQKNWSKDIIADYFLGKIVYWEEQLLVSMEIINAMCPNRLKWLDENIQIRHLYRTDVFSDTLKKEAEGLLDYLNRGGSLSRALFPLRKPFLPKNIKQRLFAIQKIQVNGNKCNTIKSLRLAIEDLELKEKFGTLSQIWEEYPLYNAHYYKYDFFRKHLLRVIDLISIVQKAENTRLEIQKISNLRINPFEEKCTFVKNADKASPGKEAILPQRDTIEYSFADILCEKIHE